MSSWKRGVGNLNSSQSGQVQTENHTGGCYVVTAFYVWDLYCLVSERFSVSATGPVPHEVFAHKASSAQKVSYLHIKWRLARLFDEVTKRATYPQDWPAYNTAQTTEKDHFQTLLRDLCNGIQQPIQTKGRPRVSLADAVFCAAFKFIAASLRDVSPRICANLKSAV